MINDIETAIAAWQAATGKAFRPNTETLISWLMDRARTADAVLRRASAAVASIQASAGDMATMIEESTRAAMQGASLPLPRGRRITFSGWTLDMLERSLTSPSGLDIALTTTEYEVLLTLLRAPNKVMTREVIAEKAMGRTLKPDDRSIDICIVRLRRKLEMDPRRPVLIKTIYGRGYLFTQETQPVFSMRKFSPGSGVIATATDCQPIVVDSDAVMWVLEVSDVEFE